MGGGGVGAVIKKKSLNEVILIGRYHIEINANSFWRKGLTKIDREKWRESVRRSGKVQNMPNLKKWLALPGLTSLCFEQVRKRKKGWGSGGRNREKRKDRERGGIGEGERWRRREGEGDKDQQEDKGTKLPLALLYVFFCSNYNNSVRYLNKKRKRKETEVYRNQITYPGV